ncbi:helix-turn-helix transcriptional regulator [Enterovibrio nigricans]|uniref:AraC-type DNA-binding protein n=1 Tax=Enterovibrio nigricans DSM 22720 TaxID=1121868 RepID=A0A1T4UKN3_9GAMM|nr:AraC family transcriptional regulator [Enterovibrio nigricans]PKF51206.1 AraC family transcriptional regulator [Enterovibrio nigricans]SKA53156.1 AraC-type DNA-binding protein [Enterovibrio nigricans DSM 22720]
MMKVVQAGQFRGQFKQPLRNVYIYAPTIIWVNQGSKQLWWHDTSRGYTPKDWLVIPASHYLTFVNVPEHADFYSRTLTFFTPPSNELLARSQKEALNDEPRITVTPQLAFCFNTLFDMNQKGLSQHAQRRFLEGFYEELAEMNQLYLLFPGGNRSLKERLAQYFSVNPGDAHPIETVAQHFSMSRATLTRKLAAEDASFRHILTHVRMVYALSLMQEHRNQIDLALRCGYQSEARFSLKFKETFGLTPRQYLKTL